MSKNKKIIYAVFTGGIILLLGTWLCLLVWGFMAIDSLRLYPHDEHYLVWWNQLLMRFENPPVGNMLAFLVLAPSFAIFIWRTLKSKNRTLIPLEFALTNIIFILISGALLFTSPFSRQYDYTRLGVLTTAALLIFLFFIQRYINLQKNKKS